MHMHLKPYTQPADTAIYLVLPHTHPRTNIHIQKHPPTHKHTEIAFIAIKECCVADVSFMTLRLSLLSTDRHTHTHTHRHTQTYSHQEHTDTHTCATVCVKKILTKCIGYSGFTCLHNIVHRLASPGCHLVCLGSGSDFRT